MKVPELFLKHILEAIAKIEEASSELSEQEFLSDENWITREAVLRQLEIIGEAVKHLSEDFRTKYPSVPWQQIAGMRNYLIHEYFSVNFERVWETIVRDIPDLKKQIGEILEGL